jgi:hypothetical protein
LKHCIGLLLNDLAAEITPNYLKGEDTETVDISRCRFVAEREEK